MSQSQQYSCNFCNSTFNSVKSLDNHKRTAKYCLEIRGKNNERHKCPDCDKTFSNNHWLSHHQLSCINYQVSVKISQRLQDFESDKKMIENENHMLKEQIEQLQQTIRQLAEKAIIHSKPAITTNNTNNTVINNLQVISEEHFISQAKHLTIDHIKKGALGYTEYFLEYPLKERIACTDYSRRKIKYKNENGDIVTDPEMTLLSDLLFKSIKERNRELTVQYSTELSDKFKTTKDPLQLAYFMEVASKFSQQDLDVFKMFNGNKNEFFHDVIRNICSKTLV